MARVDLHKIGLGAMAALSLVLLGGLALQVYQASKTRTLTFAAGSVSGESYIIGSALKTVVERHYPRVHITLAETGGTVESLQRLEQGRADLAAAQADIVPGPSARIVAVLYDDFFQLMARHGSAISAFSGLRGKAIALPKSGGQFESFLRVAEHFGLVQQDFTFVGATDIEADREFLAGRADAIFRVRALGNPAIKHLAGTGQVRFLRIEHAAAMKIKNPTFEPATVPEGAYSGDPAIPSADLPTVSIHRTLLAGTSADPEAVRTVTEVLLERRQEIMQEIPQEMKEVRLLLAQVKKPAPEAGLGPPWHAGARQYFDKDKPSFLMAHADYVGLMVTVILLIASWIWELRGWLERRQKNNADEYSNQVMALLDKAQSPDSGVTPPEVRAQLLKVLTAAVQDLDADKLSEESFHSFRGILEIVLQVTQESEQARAISR
jgi:TRAP transporter TAXI family solute receptor